MEYIIDTRGLCKSYGKCLALDHVSLRVGRGEIYGLIGDNGAGKTTFLKLLAGQIYPDGGEMELFGNREAAEIRRQRKRMGALIENPAFYPQLSVERNLEYYRIQKGVPGKSCIEEILEVTNLADKRKKLGRQLSFGMKQRLGLAIALLGEPELLLLDEPINGLDPSGIIEMRQLFLRLSREKNITILLSSHILSELEQLADVYGFLNRGVLLEQISREQLLEKCRDYIEIRVTDDAKYAALLEKRFPGQRYQVLPGQVIHILNPEAEIADYSRLAGENGTGILGLEQQKMALEDYYVKLKEGMGR